MDFETIIVERDGAVATVIINDAPRNRMSLDFMDELEVQVGKLGEDRSVRAIVVTGAGDENFSVGMDLKQLPEGVQRKGRIEAVFDQRLRVLAAIESLAKPVVATLYGYCLGGGLELPLACHFRLAAAEGAKIGLPEMDLGAVPAWGGTARRIRSSEWSRPTQRVRRAVPPQAGTEPRSSSGRPIRAPSAAARRKWQASGSSSPPPRQYP